MTKKVMFGILFSIASVSSFANAHTTFGNVRDVIKSKIGAGFRGVNLDGRACFVRVKYQSQRLILSVEGYRADGSSDALTFVPSTDSDELVVDDQSSANYPLTYVTTGTYVQLAPKRIDRRRLTINRSGVTLQYVSRYNPTGTTRGLECRYR